MFHGASEHIQLLNYDDWLQYERNANVQFSKNNKIMCLYITKNNIK